MPYSILEAMRYGLAILTTDVGANKETFATICKLVTPGNVEQLTLETDRLLSDRSYREMRQKQTLTHSENYTFKRFIDEIVPIYKQEKV